MSQEALFGDLFSQRGVYASGILYSSRRKYLGKSSFEPPDELKTRISSKRRNLQLQDHDLFPTNDQEFNNSIRNQLKTFEKNFKKPPPRDMGQSNISHSKINRRISMANASMNNEKIGSIFERRSHADKFKKTARFVIEAMHLESEGCTSTNQSICENDYEDDLSYWKEEKRAGVTYWINRSTGEIVTESPFDRSQNRSASGKRSPFSLSDASKILVKRTNSSKVQDEGTGSLVYDGTEITELFDLLDKSNK